MKGRSKGGIKKKQGNQGSLPKIECGFGKYRELLKEKGSLWKGRPQEVNKRRGFTLHRKEKIECSRNEILRAREGEVNRGKETPFRGKGTWKKKLAGRGDYEELCPEQRTKLR